MRPGTSSVIPAQAFSPREGGAPAELCSGRDRLKDGDARYG